VNLRKYLVLLGVVIFGSSGDALLSRGMKEVGEVPLNHWHQIIFAVAHPWVALGVVLLIGFFAAYMTALSWADLTYVLPATSIGYVLLAFIAKFLLHENVTATRWLGGWAISGMPRPRVRVKMVKNLGSGSFRVRLMVADKLLTVAMKDLYTTPF